MNLTFNDIKNVHKKIKDNVKWTETTFTSSISEKLGIDTFLKLENRQHTGAFKIRGSYSKLLSLSAAEKKSRCGCYVSWQSCARFGLYFQ